MDIQGTPATEGGNSNLPTSLDVTELISNLESLHSSSPIDSIRNQRNVQLIELDSHYNEVNHSRTRLFLSIAFGKQAVLAQLFALELLKVNDSDDEEEFEWADVSQKVIHHGNNSPVLIFPPSCADTLPCNQQNKFDRVLISGAIEKNVEITSCAIIPTPAIRVTSSKAAANDGEQDRTFTQRNVSVALGTSRGQVVSLLLRVSEENDSDGVTFSLRYDDCRNLEADRMRKQSDGDNIVSHPVLLQVLPSSKRLNSSEIFLGMNYDDMSFLHGDAESHVQVIHPSKSIHLQNSTQTNSVISITFGRGDWKSCHKRRKKSRHVVMLNQDVVWFTFGGGTIVKMPSWKLFFATNHDEPTNQISNRDTRDTAEGDSAAGNSVKNATVIPLNNPFNSPLDMPPPQTNRLNPSGFGNRDMDFDEQSFASKMSITSKLSTGTSYSQFTVSNDHDYWGLLSTAISSSTQQSQSTGLQNSNKAAKILVIGEQTVPGSTLPLSVQSSRVECSQLDDAKKNGTDGQTCLNASAENDDNSWASSSEDEHYGLVTGAVVGGTAALVRGALGAAFGAVRWGFGGGAAVEDIELDQGNIDHVDDSLDIAESDENESNDDGGDQFEIGSENGPRNPAVVQNGETLDLLPWPLCNTSLLFSDVPRRFENAVVDPSSSLVATTDNLGRVVLFDLETHQPIRMWKGVRNVTLHFAELPSGHPVGGKSARSRLYLVIHAYIRGTIEVYRLRQGPRVAVAAVPEQNRGSIIECLGPPSDGSRISSFLFETIAGSDRSKQCILDYIVIDDNRYIGESVPKNMQQPATETGISMQLNFLVQLLAPDTNIQCNTNTILNTFKSIPLSGLGDALDVVSKSQKMEQLGAEGSSFHSLALTHCKTRLERAVEKELKEGSGLLQKSVISNLSSKIAYHENLIRAYDVLNRYEARSEVGQSEDDAEDTSGISNKWALEAISWISVAEGHDVFKPLPTKQRDDLNKPLTFFRFASACSPTTTNNKTRGSNSDAGVYLTEVKREREPILMRIFRPLLEDLFVFKVVNSILSQLGIYQDFHIQQQYFGEWISTLASYDVAQTNLSGHWRPMFRWLQDLIISAYDLHQRSPIEFDKGALEEAVRLQTLLDFCVDMEDLIKAFLLAVLCKDAVSAASRQIEEKTYGKITALECVQPWEVVLRKLRVLLLVSFRLSGDVNPIGTGVNPMKVGNISEFSTFYWIARDELSLSHDNQVLMALESACLSNSQAFYPSSSDGDDEANKKVILQSCSYKKNSILNPSGLTNDINSRPLLFYLRDHGKCATHLAAHRALILGKLWGRTPSNSKLLYDAVSTLLVVTDKFEQFSMATVVDFYQSYIRPTCHAMMFGFLDGHESFKDDFSPLIDDDAWRHEFLSAAKKILSLIIKCAKKNVTGISQSHTSLPKENAFHIAQMWPPLQEDPFLVALAKKFRNVSLSSIELHHSILFAYELTGSLNGLEAITTSIHGLFAPGAMYLDMGCKSETSPQQFELLDHLLVNAAKKIGQIIDGFELGNIEMVGRSIGIDARYCRTRFFIEAYRFGKDVSIDDVMTTNVAYLDKQLFVDEIVHIVCQRLDSTITSLKKSKSYRGVVGVLDADTIRWVKEMTTQQPSIQDNLSPVSLIATHSLVQKIESISKTIPDKMLERQISDLSNMSTTLLKAVSQEQRTIDI